MGYILVHRFARERMGILSINRRGKEKGLATPDYASMMCIDASMGSSLPVRREDGHLLRRLAGEISSKPGLCGLFRRIKTAGSGCGRNLRERGSCLVTVSWDDFLY